MKRTIYATILIALALLSAGCVKSGAPGEYAARRVLDGDTIELAGGERVRYLGIDTPETRRRVGREWVYDPEPLAPAALEYNQRLVLGKRLELEFDVRKEDRYGRLLAFVYADGKMVNAELLRAGLAWYVVYPPNTAHQDELLAAQAEARANVQGIWRGKKPLSPSDAAGHVGEFCIVRGEVYSTGRSRDAAYINFGKNRSSTLTAVIYSGNLVLFEKEGIFPTRDYEGRRVEIYGKVKYEYGPRMVIYHPSQIKIVD